MKRIRFVGTAEFIHSKPFDGNAPNYHFKRFFLTRNKRNHRDRKRKMILFSRKGPGWFCMFGSSYNMQRF